jgi:geranylgeranyl diphosphate synthase type II
VSIQDYHQLFLDYLEDTVKLKEPENLYEPELYILQLGGKRLRPILTLIAAEAFGSKPLEALPAALAVEVFHNFTLLHDDIMDQAAIRRGKPTVHKKWNVNTGILSGDVMLIDAYRFFEVYEPEIFKNLVQLFSKTAVEVCEGQQYDMDFESRNDVTLDAYLHMIKYKTSVLVAAALQMGAIISGASTEEQKNIYNFGISLGLAFQLQDDYLDTFGDQKTFGKKIGGDILENKKTWLFLKAKELTDSVDTDKLSKLYSENLITPEAKIAAVQKIFRKYQVDDLIKQEINKYSNKALILLENMPIKDAQKKLLEKLVIQLKERQK